MRCIYDDVILQCALQNKSTPRKVNESMNPAIVSRMKHFLQRLPLYTFTFAERRKGFHTKG